MFHHVRSTLKVAAGEEKACDDVFTIDNLSSDSFIFRPTYTSLKAHIASVFRKHVLDCCWNHNSV